MKAKQGKRRYKTKFEKSKKTKADFSASSNSQDNDSHKSKNGVFESNGNMEVGVFWNDDEIQEDFSNSNNNNSMNDSQEVSGKKISGSFKEGKRSTKARKMKESKGKGTKSRKKLKRSAEEYNNQQYRSEIDSLRELTKYRSLKLGKEREDQVEPRGLAPDRKSVV